MELSRWQSDGSVRSNFVTPAGWGDSKTSLTVASKPTPLGFFRRQSTAQSPRESEYRGQQSSVRFCWLQRRGLF